MDVMMLYYTYGKEAKWNFFALPVSKYHLDVTPPATPSLHSIGRNIETAFLNHISGMLQTDTMYGW